jgi:hypothetical protein
LQEENTLRKAGTLTGKIIVLPNSPSGGGGGGAHLFERLECYAPEKY